MPDNPLMDEQQENERFLEMPDEEVVVLAQNGDGQALAYLLNKYKNFVRSKARSYFLIGADHEDIVQEGSINPSAIFSPRAWLPSVPLRNYASSARLLPPLRLPPGKSMCPSTAMYPSISPSTMRNPIARCWM